MDDPDDFTPEQISADVEVTDDMMEQSNDKRSEAMSAMGDGKILTLKAPIATKVVCFSRLLKCLKLSKTHLS